MLREPARDEETRTGLTESQVVEPVAYREQMLKERRKTEITITLLGCSKMTAPAAGTASGSATTGPRA